MFFNDSTEIRNEINRYFTAKYADLKKYWQFDPLYSNKVQLNWVEQYKTKLNAIILYPRIYKGRSDTEFLFRKTKDFELNIMTNLFIYFNNKMILSLDFSNNKSKSLEDIIIYNDVFVNLKNSQTVEIPTIETIESNDTEKVITSFKVLHGGDLLEYNTDIEKI